MRSALRFAAAIISLAWVLLASPPVLAQQDAASSFSRGTEAYETGDFAEAARAFRAAYESLPHAAAVFNEARALERLGDAPRAADAYSLALARHELRAEDQAEAQARLSTLLRTLGSVELTGAPELRASIGHVQQASLPIRTHLAVGRYELLVQRNDGRRATLTVEARAGKLTRLHVANEGFPWTPPSHRMAMPASRSGLRVPTAAYAAFGGAALATFVGSYLGVKGLAARNDFDASGQTDAPARDRAVKLRAWANVSFAAALALGATGGLLVWRSSSAAAALSLRPITTAAGGVDVKLGFSGRF